MRVAFAVPEFPGLSETFILSQIAGLLDRGHEVDIYAQPPVSRGKVHRTVEEYGLLERTHYQPRCARNRLRRVVKGITLLGHCALRDPRLGMAGVNFFRYGRHAASLYLLHALMPLLDRPSFDIVHCHFGPVGLRMSLLRDLGAIQGKLVTSFHGYDVNTYPRRHGENVYGKLWEFGDLYTVNSAFTGQRVVKLGGPADKIVKLPMGVDTDRFKFTERSAEPGGEFRIVTVGRLVEVKGIEHGIRAVARLAAAHSNVRYLIAGDGPLASELRALADSLGIAAQVEFLGGQTQTEVRELLGTAHVFLLPGVIARDGAQEGQGLVLLEAQAAGLPVVATRVGGIPEFVLDNESGFLVPQRDADALADKLDYLIGHPEQRTEMGRSGRRLVEERFSIDRLNDRLVEVYEDLLA
jgi:colanic acid/amylovoran biosynthesis glycosyltransferase